MKTAGINLVGVKEYNRALILQLICTHPGSTRQFLARKASLTKMTLTNITGELMQKGLIQEGEEPSSRAAAGRTPKALEIAPSSPVVAGIWISRDLLYGIVTDLTLGVITTRQVSYDPGETQQTLIGKLVALSRYLVEYSNRPVAGLGIASIGIIDLVSGSINKVVNFFGVGQLPIRELLCRELDVPVFVNNDMHASGLCELYFGMGKQLDTFLYFGITAGVGSSVISGRQPLQTNSSSGEMGHMSIDLNGPPCECGSRGCLEMYASTDRILQVVETAFGRKFGSFREAMEFCGQSPDHIRVLADVEEKLAHALNNLVNILDIQTIVMGHDGYFLPDGLVDQLEQHINRISIFRDAKQIVLCKTPFGEKSPLFGAVCIVLDRIFSGQLLL